MPPEPLYNPRNATPAYHLRYSWTGWPSDAKFSETPTHLLEPLRPLWEHDGLRLLKFRWTAECVQLLFSATPAVSPELIAGRAKGRLDHALHQAGCQMPLSRKLAVRSIGDNTRQEVEDYIERQVGKERFVDPRFEARLSEFTVTNPKVDLAQPTETARGRYWYNLHLVLVVEGRMRIADMEVLAKLRDTTLAIAAKKGHAVSRLAVMPDHLHVAIRGGPAESPHDLVFAYQNNLAYALGQQRIWCDNFYVGTFSEYDIDAIRRMAE